jgi:hypothetical protein
MANTNRVAGVYTVRVLKREKPWGNVTGFTPFEPSLGGVALMIAPETSFLIPAHL